MKPDHHISSLSKRDRITKRSKALENVGLMENIRSQLKRASPHSSERLLADLAVDISDLVRVARMHQSHVKTLLGMKFPRDREKFCNVLALFDVNLLFENQFHVASMKRRLPRLVRDVCNTPKNKKR